ncbi:hypothetical protein [Ancylobacter mangrovi]|uniref:KTSC domain-containing protein n=1 Tax=Ancylobacter mangrovi TaxID=2972472 RepID=A0A9X2PG25_9HYPH|nr:hypothetical protein [Ancylobacter mangrovi]MCS0495513.1 hypothetical protein [Ancylobacter mangrovi]MCS0503161.1 hypothetical protein [Ancylobacter mangrovi]
MRAVLFALAFPLAASPALAQSMPNSLDLSCAAAFDMVRQKGAVVMATGPNIYDRYVSDQRYCGLAETTFPVWIQTSDMKQCFVGYRCREPMVRNR